ncbi:MAG: serpin family protein [Candidatus Marinimicrobia bacterium]|nr:serpin family protein [Candidatus Neomarinimicrobiota bacterium]
MKTIIYVILVSALFFGCDGNGTSPVDHDYLELRPLTAREQSLVDSNQQFGLNLLQAISTVDSTGNIFISPLSVSMALGMTMNGASGQTYTDMQSTLELVNLSESDINQAYKSIMDLLMSIDPDVITEIANSIWIKEDFPVEAAFIDTNEFYFDAWIAERNFADPITLDEINSWVADNTNDKITEILDRIPAEAVMYLINAIYFKAIWEFEFNKNNTHQTDFFITPDNITSVDIMGLTADLNYYANDQVQVVDLPYGRGNYTMTVFLPKPDKNLTEFVAVLNCQQLEHYLGNLQYKSGTVFLPKLKTNYKLLMNDVLKQMGMEIAFTRLADFSRINPEDTLLISRVIHEAFVQIDEEGTEAAATTVVEIIRLTESTGPSLDFVMEINRPYLFLIRELESGTVLFMGKIHEPVWED